MCLFNKLSSLKTVLVKHIIHKCLLPVSAFHVSYQIPKQHIACNIMSHHHQDNTFVKQDNQPHETDCWPFEI